MGRTMSYPPRFAKIIAFVALSLASGTATAGQEKTGVLAQTPAVSPDGSKIAFSADFDGAARIWIANIDGAGLRKLHITPRVPGDAELEPSWSPDGAYIAYAVKRVSGSQIAVSHLMGGHTLLVTAGANHESAPAWAENRLVFVSDRAGTKDLWIASLDGGGLRRLTALPGEENRPSVSPDGTQVVFSYTSDADSRLMTVPVSGGTPKQITGASAGKHPVFDWEPNWGGTRNRLLL